MKKINLLSILVFSFSCLHAQIDRKSVVSRHNVELTKIDTLASLSVGNGAFAFTVDATGLQTFPEFYEKGIPLGTESEWGWDSYPNTENYTFEETLVNFEQYGRTISYATQRKTPAHAREAVNYFRANPHRVQLGNLGFEIIKKDGSIAKPSDLQNIHQQLNLWTGIITSSFEIEGTPVKVTTACHQENDVIGVHVASDLIAEDRLKIALRIPYPTGGWEDFGTRYQADDLDYTSSITSNKKSEAVILHQMDSLQYHIGFQWDGKAKLQQKSAQYFELIPKKGKEFAFSCEFSEKAIHDTDFKTIKQHSTTNWEAFWQSGAAVDFSDCKDKRAFELERRVVLSQYLTKLQCTGKMPPQETGLTYNSWYGKPHLEMHWWHGVHFPLWGRSEYLAQTLPWYEKVFYKAKELAKRQGFEGARWQKMTDPYGNEGPSSVGAFLVWQQPHFITYAELLYRDQPTSETLKMYAERVFATADFMASFAHFNPETNSYDLGPGVIPAQERFPKMETYNPTYELAYWQWALQTAMLWKERLGAKVPEKWATVATHMSSLPVQDTIYLATASAKDSYTNAEYLTDHPSVLGTFGMLPKTPLLNQQIMQQTFDKVWNVWTWEDTWGWDFPMTAMTATRLGMPEKAIDALFMGVQTNTYLPNGHNYQEERLTLYLPGNGGLLTTIALMCAGWDGSEIKNPGFPKDGNWNVQWEGLKKMF
ncbi:hypothetical protein SAMN05216480_102180 [Pustulibacterium marinum]|uniref:Glycosyl hydrolase family 65, N-terminal domain n=1 Tax=Pustulibacterium marinum TaxID=1224947 RepID=A0A1I7FSA9_9FLAO|nr:hypothetical protein [Pustulibacterium marinum]SFU39053.1 hypothetical protein SAMN05216480_102180 [Pustulibacterium marinum]